MEKLEELNELASNLMLKEEGAFEAIYNAYKNRVFYIAMEFFGDEATAEDIVQETFITVYKNIDQLNSSRAFAVWLHKIAYHKCLRLVEKDKKSYVDLKEDESIEDFEDKNAPSIDDEVNRNELFNIVKVGIQNMKAGFREVAIFRLLEDMSINEISEIMDIPEGTVKSRLSTVRSKLQKELAKHGINVSIVSSFAAFPGIVKLYQEYQSSFVVETQTADAILKGITTTLEIGCETVGVVTTVAQSFNILKWFSSLESLVPAKVVGIAAVTASLGLGTYTVVHQMMSRTITLSKPEFGQESIVEREVMIPVFDEESKIDFDTIRCDGCDLTVAKTDDYSGVLKVNLSEGEHVRIYVSNENDVTTYVDIKSILSQSDDYPQLE